MTERMLRAIESPHTDILGHCTGRIVVGRGRAPSTFDAESGFRGVRANRHRRRDQLATRPSRSSRGSALARPFSRTAC